MTARLNPGQSAAVQAPAGGLFVSAGAGTGKTRVLTDRYVRIALEGVSGPAESIERLMAITFTEKAAANLTRRIRERLVAAGWADEARHVDRAWVGTIHGTCARLLRRHALVAGLDPRFEVLDEVRRGALETEALEDVMRADSRAVSLLDEIGVECATVWIPRLAAMRAGAVGLAPSPSAGTDLARVIEAGRDDLIATIRRLEGVKQTDTVCGNIEAARDLIEAIEGWTEERNADLLAAAAGCKVGRRGSAEAVELADAIGSAASALALRLADELGNDLQARLLGVVDAFTERFAALKAERGALDFDDLQTATVRLLESVPEIRDAHRKRWLEVMVDEFQDTDGVQAAILDGLTDGAVVTVGDERQSIYAFRGADVEVFRRRAADLPPDRHHALTENYRSHRELLAFFNALFSREPFWPGQHMPLEAGDGGGGHGGGVWPEGRPRVEVMLGDPVGLRAGEKHAMEARALAARLAGLVDEGLAEPGEIAVLLRSATRAKVFESALRDAGLPVVATVGGGFFDTLEVDELTALVRVLWDPEDDEAFARFLSGRMCALADDSLWQLASHARDASGGLTRPVSLWAAARDEARSPLEPDEEDRLQECLRAVESATTDLGRRSLSSIVLDLCEDTAYDLALFAADDRRGWANVLKFSRLAGEFERLEPGSPAGLLEHLARLRTHAVREPEAPLAAMGENAVRMMSIHAAKGLEFPVVAVADLGGSLRGGRDDGLIAAAVDGGLLHVGMRLPPVSPGGPKHDTTSFLRVCDLKSGRSLEEEKRLLYVAFTRAERALILSGLSGSGDRGGDSRMSWVLVALRPGGGAEGGVLECGCPVAVAHVEPSDAPETPPTERRRAQGVTAEALTRQPAGRGHEAGHAPANLSFSALSAYEKCPYGYYARNILRLPGPLDAGSSERAAFGSAFHAALEIGGADAADEGVLRRAAEAVGLSAQHLDRLGAAVKAVLEDPQVLRALDGGLREVPFATMVDGTVLDGKMDLVRRDGDTTFIVDYKTGVNPATEARRVEYGLQATCYALAALREGASRVEVAFVHPEGGSKTDEFDWGQEDLSQLEARVTSIVRSIAEGRFPHRGSYEKYPCDMCPALGGLCPVSRPAV